MFEYVRFVACLALWPAVELIDLLDRRKHAHWLARFNADRIDRTSGL